jgi:CRP-like cAMP-binding protein
LPVPLTQEELARMVGTTRESVNRCLAGLTARGLLRIEDRRYVLPDPEALAPALSEG